MLQVQVGDRAVGWLEALEPGKNLVLDAPWELQLAKEMGSAAGLLAKKKGESDKDSEEARYRSVRLYMYIYMYKYVNIYLTI